MRAVLTRVSEAAVTVAGETVGAIDCPETGGLLALVGVSREDLDDWAPRHDYKVRPKQPSSARKSGAEKK